MSDARPSTSPDLGRLTRRELLRVTLGTGAVLAGGSVLAACGPAATNAVSAALPPPETKTIRIVAPPECDPGVWLVRDLLLEEGFTDIRYIDTPFVSRKWLLNREADVALAHPEFAVASIDAGVPILALAGLHAGCLELWAGPGIANVRDLRGKTVAVFAKDPADQFFAFFSALFGYVGIDPLKDVRFVEVPPDYSVMMNAYIEGRSDAFLAGASAGPLLHRNLKTPGKVIVDMTKDKPWSENFCCHLVAHRDWARQNPVATKRVTRAVLRATDAAAKDRTGAAHQLVTHGDFADEAILNETIADLSYDWRERDPEDTLRFFALKLADVKLIKSTPQQILAQGSDFAYMRQLRKELPL